LEVLDQSPVNEMQLSAPQPKVNIIVTPIKQSVKEIPIRMYNQVAVMINISDDEVKNEQAIKFVSKLNHERRERERKHNEDFNSIEKRIKRDLG